MRPPDNLCFDRFVASPNQDTMLALDYVAHACVRGMNRGLKIVSFSARLWSERSGWENDAKFPPQTTAQSIGR